MKLNKVIYQIIYGAAFILLLHFLSVTHSYIFNQMIKGIKVEFLTDTHIQTKVMIINWIILFSISIACLQIFKIFKRIGSNKILLFLTTAGALYIVFSTLYNIWKYYTFHFCTPNSYEITVSRLIQITLSTITLIFSIFPISITLRNYSSNQIIVTVILFIIYLYLNTFYFAWYFKLFF